MIITTFFRVFASQIKDLLQNTYKQASYREKFLFNRPVNSRGWIESNVHIDSKSTIGEKSVINQNVSIIASEILPNAIIEKDTEIINTKVKENINIGKNCIIQDSQLEGYNFIEQFATVEHCTVKPYVRIKKNCWITNSIIQSYSYIGNNSSVHNTFIGKFCSIAQNLSCGSGNHPTHMISTSPIFYSTSNDCGISFCENEVYSGHSGNTIGNDVWIGANVFIRSGVKIGNGAIIAAGSVVVKDVPPYTIIGGVPAKEIRKRFNEEDITILENLQWWNWNESILRKAAPLIQKGNAKELYDWYEKQLTS